MTHTISDNELIQELKRRFEKREELFTEQLALLTELKHVNEKLVTSEGLKSNFLSNIRNEINNPVASILELSKSILEGEMSAEAVRKFASLIYSETFSLDFQLRNIFASAEIEAGEAKLAPVSVNAISLLENTLLLYKHQIQKKNIHLIIHTKLGDNEAFCSDPEKLHLIFSNLIANAIQFSPVNGDVEIKLDLENNHLYFSILDNGPGINDRDRKIIFDRFRQIEEGSTKSYGGHGLGLCISKSLLELIGGEIMVDSEKGKGSIFSIIVPESEKNTAEKDIFSTDGNDFMFVENGITL